MKKFCLFLFVIACTTSLFAQNNVGIGTSTPAFKLDVLGRLRLQHNPGNNQSAGLWLDGTSTVTRSFIGTIDNDHVGIWGSGGVGWNFSMNVNNGNTGIGTTAPTTTLDVDGSLRLRGDYPAKGSLLISKDANGNCAWQKLYAFKVSGLLDDYNIYVSAGQTVPLVFNIPDYNIGFMYSVNSNSFTAPVKGIYHFDTHVSTYKTSVGATYGESPRVQLMMKRGITNTIIEQSRFSLNTMDDSNLYGPAVSNTMSTDIMLEANDIIWIQVNPDYPQLVEGDKFDTSFSGRLVTQL